MNNFLIAWGNNNVFILSKILDQMQREIDKFMNFIGDSPFVGILIFFILLSVAMIGIKSSSNK